MKMCDFWVKWGIFEEKTRVFHINGGFAKRKRVIFASMGDLRKRVIFGVNVDSRRENA